MALYNLRDSQDLVSNQIGAISGGNAPKLHYADYVEATARALPALEESEYNRKIQEEEIRLNNEARRQASRDANIALGIQGTNIAMNPIALKYGSKVLSALTPKPVSMLSSIAQAPAGIQSAIQPWASQVIPQAPNTLNNQIISSARTFGNGANPTYGNLAKSFVGDNVTKGNYASSLTSVGTDETGLLAKIGGSGNYLGKLGENAGLSSTASNIGANIATAGINYGIEKSNVGEFMHKKVGGGAQQWDDVATTLTSFATAGPIGAGVNLLRIGGRELFKKCIIITCCYGENSDEIEIARAYRDKFFTREILRGYYYFSEPVVDLMTKYPEVKEYYKKNLAEPLLRVAKFKLNLTKEHPSAIDCATAANMTNLWHDMGVALKSFIRSNGEEI
jgi:hypothetical protein